MQYFSSFLCGFCGLILISILQLAINVTASGSNATTIGQCTFYGDKHIECRGRLRCKPSDFSTISDANGVQRLPDLEQVCPGVDEVAKGNWSVIQGIVPTEYAYIPYPAEIVAKCQFRTNGSFYCVGGPIWPDTFWEGIYSGSLNSAFELGLDKWYARHLTTIPTTRTTTRPTTTRLRGTVTHGRWLPAPPIGPGPEQERDDDDVARQRNRQGDDDDTYEQRVRNEGDYPARQRETLDNENGVGETGSDDGSTTPLTVTYDDLQRVTGTRDEVNRYDAQRATQLEDNEQTSMTFTVAPQRVYVCEYHNNGQVGCRNCTEKIMRIVLETGEIGNRRDYNCTQPKSGPILKRWNIDNGIIPMTPDPQALSRQVVATCIFEKSAQTYECHGESALCPDLAGNRVHTNKCLGGKRWSGDFTGDFGYLT